MPKKYPKICREARTCAERWRSNFHKNIDGYHAMTRFVLGEQWNEEEEEILESFKKVPLQFNKLATLANTMVGEQLQNTPQLQVVPMDNCDPETAKIRELIVKDIMFSGDAKNTYQVSASQAFIGGFSGFAVLTDYCHAKSFDQDFKYIHFKDPTRCYWDVGAEEINKTDGMYCGWITRVTREHFRDTYGVKIEEKIKPDSNPIAATQEEVAQVSAPGDLGSQYVWADEDSVSIQHHFVKRSVPDRLFKLSNGHIVTQSEMDEIIEHSEKMREELIIKQRMLALLQAQPQLPLPHMSQMQDPNMGAGHYDPLLGQQAPVNISPNESPMAVPNSESSDDDDHIVTLYDGDEIVRIEDEKDSTRYKIKHYQICGEYILDETDFPCEQLPLIFVDQNSFYDKDGKQVCRPFLVDAKDAQKYINYLGTQSAYVLKVSRYDQWIGSKKNVASQDTQQKWKDPIALQGMLTFDESPSGVVPRRVEPPELSQSLLTQYTRAIEDLYTSTGLYPTRLGQQGNEISGSAIDARTRQGSYSTYIAFNSINRAIAKGGEIVNEMIPHIYDSTRVIALMTPDEGMKNIVINRQSDEYGELVENDIRKGTYQVRLLPGPSYEGQKEQALLSLNAALQADPEIFPLIADLYAENLPLANTIELKNRLRTLVPQNILDAGKTGKQPKAVPPPPDPKMIEAQQKAQYNQAQMNIKQQEIIIKRQELQLKAQKQDADTRLEMAKLQSEQDQLEAQSNRDRLNYLAETQRTEQDMQKTHANNFAKILTSKPHQTDRGNNDTYSQY